MARGVSTDYYQGFAFHVREPNNFLFPSAGFQAVSVPETTVGIAEYREGIFRYTRKQPGIPTQNDLTLTQGVTKRRSDFFAWLLNAIEGRAYRTDLEIYHFHRTDTVGVDGVPSRVYRALEAFPTRVKLAGDLDGTSEDISLTEIDIVFEELQVTSPGAAATSSSPAT